MKKFKSFILCLAILLSTIFVGGLNVPRISNENASAVPVNGSTVFTHASLSQYGQTLDLNNFKTFDNTTYVVANGSITINLKPFSSLYTNITNSPEFHAQKTNIVIEKDSNNNWPTSFTFEGEQIYFWVSESTTSGTVIHFRRTENDRVSYMTTEDTGNTSSELVTLADVSSSRIILQITKSYTWLETANSAIFTYSAAQAFYTTKTTYSFSFERPAVNFNNASNPVLLFETEVGGKTSSDNLLAREQEFSNVKVSFLNNNYNPVNELIFNINYNGFTYNFKLYSKTVGLEELLFVDYIDSAKPENNAYLASMLSDDNSSIIKRVSKASNDFNMIFKDTGRYEIEIYDSTYLQGMKNANYYSTSFYIKSEDVSPFDNIYMIAQSKNDNGLPIEYIVSNSTQNHTVGLTIKNLKDIIDSEDLRDTIEVEHRKTIYGASENEPIITTYTSSQIASMLSDDGDLEFPFEDDADYGVIIYDKNSNKKIEYFVTVAKRAKTHYNANGNNHTATIPYHTEVINYTFNIDSRMEIFWNFSNGPEQNETINKSYINRYSISYGMQRVEITSTTSEGDDDNPKGITIKVQGVGDITVSVSVDGGEAEVRTLNSERGNGTWFFGDYGKYSVTITDSMGTTSSATFDFKQSVNASTIVLIVLSAVIVSVVVFFVLRARGRVKTR